MNFRNIVANLTNKAPKVLLILVVLFGLSLSRNQLWGYKFTVENQSGDTTELVKLAEGYFNRNITLSTDDGVVYRVWGEQSQGLGTVLSSRRFSNVLSGYGGQTPVVLFMDTLQRITAVEMLPNYETKRFVRRVEESGLLNQWSGRRIGERVNADAVSGATYTSNAVIANVEATLEYVSQNSVLAKGINWDILLPQLMIMVVVILSLVCFFAPARTKKLRLPLLAVSLLVLGVWQGAFVSIELLYKWSIFGTSFYARFALVAIVALALLIPLLLSRSWYCNYLCPFGAAQELIGKINDKKIAIPRRLLSVFRWVRQLGIVAIIILLFINPNFDPSEVEPFIVFLINSATTSVIVIASASLIASLFVSRAWCRLLCPTGELMSLLQRKLDLRRKNSSNR